MLVLTRKLDEQILIGDDIKVTLIRVRGNTVRIGIEAPRDIRIVRGELEPLDQEGLDEGQISDREQAFAHPPKRNPKSNAGKSRVNDAVGISRLTRTPQSHMFVGTVKPSGKEAKLSRAPLAGFVAAG
ncbi:MAG: carbon storage regulator [Pirellulaceae bacterium]|nr:carbon storage regulator [Pirellulaceae bacterium]